MHRGFPEGLRASVPVVVGYLPTAVAFGVAVQSAGLNATETVLMSLIVYSGASQFALVGLLAAGASWLAMAAIGLVLGIRHVLYGPSLVPHLRRLDTARAAVAAFGLTDEAFAVASVKLTPGQASLMGFGWLMGLETGAYVSWTLGSWIGAVAGTAVASALPSLAPALSFALPALFVALLVSFVRPGGPEPGRSVPVPVASAVLAAGVVAAALHLAGLGSWSVPAAGGDGPAVGLLLWRVGTGAG